jgi:hypothetical protein
MKYRPATSTDHQSNRNMDLITNQDGSVDIYMGPDAPVGKEKNWIPTIPGKAWFPHFRLYSPKKAFLDRTWILPDIEKVK